MMLAINCILAYLIGSIPTAIWAGKFVHKMDIREHGSKNAGATNTFRVFGKKLGWFVLIIDVSKGVIASTLPLWMQSHFIGYENERLILQLSAAFAAVLGHVFPVFAGFRGGKGVATSLGIVIGINPIAALICLSFFLIVFVSFRYVSLGAMSAAIAFPIVSFFLLKNHNPFMLGFTIILAFLVIIAHSKNISRLWKGEENKMNLFRK